MNPELVNTEPLLPGEISIRFLGAPGYNIVVNRAAHALVLRVLLVISCRWNLQLTALNSRPELSSDSTNSCLTEAYLAHIFSVRHFEAFLHSGALEGTSPLHLGAVFNSRFVHGKCTNIALGRPREGCLSTEWELRHKGRGCLVWPQLETCIWGDSHFLPLCACPRMFQKALQILLWGLQTNFSEYVNLQIQSSTSNGDGPDILSFTFSNNPMQWELRFPF